MKNTERRLIDIDVLISEIKNTFDCDYGEYLINPTRFLDLVEDQEIISITNK